MRKLVYMACLILATCSPSPKSSPVPIPHFQSGDIVTILGPFGTERSFLVLCEGPVFCDEFSLHGAHGPFARYALKKTERLQEFMRSIKPITTPKDKDYCRRSQEVWSGQ
jgi:hypothetical protein